MRRMNRTQSKSVPNPQSAAPATPGAISATGLLDRSPTWAPSHIPKNEAPQAQSGVRSQPTTMHACANQRGIPATLTR